MMIHVWVAVLFGLIGVLIGALGAAWVIHVKLVDRVSSMERRVVTLEGGRVDDRTHTDTRIFEVVGLVKEIISLASTDREEWRTLRADMRALIEAVKAGRAHG
jgi:hypothetical protein